MKVSGMVNTSTCLRDTDVLQTPSRFDFGNTLDKQTNKQKNKLNDSKRQILVKTRKKKKKRI